jgi:hypothetical protein
MAVVEYESQLDGRALVSRALTRDICAIFVISLE